jgi:hypothetical protein
MGSFSGMTLAFVSSVRLFVRPTICWESNGGHLRCRSLGIFLAKKVSEIRPYESDQYILSAVHFALSTGQSR